MANQHETIFRIRRFDPERHEAPKYQDFTVPTPPGMVVLDGLWYVKEHLDPTLTWRASCRMGVCGSCGMMVNGRPTLACNTQVRDAAVDGVLELAPLPNFDVVRDLVPGLETLFESHRRAMPYLLRHERGEAHEPTGALRQSPEELLDFLQFSYCIKCGCCVAACPTAATDVTSPGPQALAQGYRYLVDSRDEGFEERRELYSGESGPWRCHFAGECSQACPKGVDPARAIQLMKRELVLDSFGLSRIRRRPPAAVIPKRPPRRCEDVPQAPPTTVE